MASQSDKSSCVSTKIPVDVIQEYKQPVSSLRAGEGRAHKFVVFLNFAHFWVHDTSIGGAKSASYQLTGT